MLLPKNKFDQEDHFGQSIDKLILLQEDNTRPNLQILLETMVMFQDKSCLMKQLNKRTGTTQGQGLALARGTDQTNSHRTWDSHAG
jgi:hypothetical protein